MLAYGLLSMCMILSAAASADDEAVESSGGVARLAAVLRESDSFKVRATAAVALGRSGSSAIAALVEAARGDEHFAVRAAAASALGKIGDAQAVPALLATAHDADQYVRNEAVVALRAFHTSAALPAFREALRSEDSVDRQQAVRAYAEVMRSADASPALVSLVLERVGDNDADVAEAARVGVRTLGHERALPALLAGLASDDSAVRAGAAGMLRERTDAAAVAPLTVMLMKVDEDASVHDACTAALRAHAEYIDASALRAQAGSAGHPERLSSLRVLAALRDANVADYIKAAQEDRDVAVRLEGARAAFDLGGERARKLLSTALEAEPDARAKRQLVLLLKGL
jgi:HEAT repeat protein